MKKYYLKKASKQDVTKTVVVNTNAVTDFFGFEMESVKLSDKEIEVKYNSDSNINTVSIGKRNNDIRIFIKKNLLEINDIICYQKNDDESYTISFIKPTDERYTYLSSKLIDNHLITDSITDIKSDSNKSMIYPLNQILYGPPGTGKTYTTIKKSLEILGLETGDPTENAEIFRSQLNHRIFFVTMHPSYSYEDFVQGMKPETNEMGQLVFKQKDGIFKKVAKLTNDFELNDGIDENINYIPNNDDILKAALFVSKFNTISDSLVNKKFNTKTDKELYQKFSDLFNIKINSFKQYRDIYDYYIEDNGRIGHKPKDDLKDSKLWKKKSIYDSYNTYNFEEFSKIIDEIFSSKDQIQSSQNNNSNRNFVIILDEINRANISKVFGELITLIEDDKRIGGENEMSLVLSSGEEFSVPSNLYIIGTMNTADKSIALVDLALRRRFEFEAMYPASDIILEFGKKECDEKKVFLDAINEQLIEAKGVDFQIGHAYFLKDNTLNEVINKNILPLLVEYFRNDLKKVESFMNQIGYPIIYTNGLLTYVDKGN